MFIIFDIPSHNYNHNIIHYEFVMNNIYCYLHNSTIIKEVSIYNIYFPL